MVDYRCKNCIWYDTEHESLKDIPDNLGYCRKHKPIIYGKDGKYYGDWPLVDKNDLCGEFRGGK